MPAPAAPAILTRLQFLAAVLAGQAALKANGGWINTIGLVDVPTYQSAAHAARTAYLAGDHDDAVLYAADVLTADWRNFRHQASRDVAIHDGAKFIAYIESFAR